MTAWHRFVVRLLRPVASPWRRFMSAEVRVELTDIRTTQAAILEALRGGHVQAGSERPRPPLDVNVLLHESRSALLRSVPPGADTFLSVGCSGSWYFDWVERCYGRVRRHVGVEYYAAAPGDLPDNVTWITNTASDLSEVGGESCDLLFSGQNIEHLWPEEVTGFLIEAARVVRSGGHLVVDSPNRALTAPLNWSHPEHTVELTLPEISHLVALAGFDVTRTAGIWLCRDPSSGTLLPFDPNLEASGWSVSERLICALAAPVHSFIWWLEARRASRPVDGAGLRERMREIFDAAWPERTERMQVAGGHVETRDDGDWVVCSPGQPGAVLFGPYMPLRAGRYQCTFRMAVPGRSPARTRVARCEVIAGSTDTPRAHRDVTPMSGTADVILDFELPQTEFGVQFRCISYGNAGFACRRTVQLAEATSPP